MRYATVTALILAGGLSACGGPQPEAPGEPSGQAELAEASEPPVNAAPAGNTDGAGEAAEVQPERAGQAGDAPFELKNIARDGQAATVSVSYADGISEFDPRLARRIAETSMQSLESFETEAKAMGAGAGGNSPAHSLGINWRVTYRGDRVISLVRDVSYYTGGAHPNATASTLIWDRERGGELGLADLFGSEEVAYGVLLEPVRERLTEARSVRNEMMGATREELRRDVEDAVSREAGSLSRLGIAAGDAGNTGLVVIFPPYEVAPYAEGSYAITLPARVFRDDVIAPYRSIFEPR